MDSNGVYLHVIKVSSNVSFWQEYAYAFDFDDIELICTITPRYSGGELIPNHQ